MTDCARDVLNLLSDLTQGARIGRERAMRIADMQKCWTYSGQHVWDDRVVKGAVKELLEVHGVPVGSSRVVGHSGYFLIASTEDIAAAERPLRGEIISLARRLQTINPKSDFARHLAGQIELQQAEEQY